MAETLDKELSVEFLRSEAILQLSAAADQNQWLHVQGFELDAVFAIPDILQDEVVAPLWINHKIGFRTICNRTAEPRLNSYSGVGTGVRKTTGGSLSPINPP
ncbi:MAG: hypothetical protein IPG64_21285 [Haliea sp.]|nr:hypothetical protein [Haliea sp.]